MPHKIEIFVSSCPLCRETLEVIPNIASWAFWKIRIIPRSLSIFRNTFFSFLVSSLLLFLASPAWGCGA